MHWQMVQSDTHPTKVMMEQASEPSRSPKNKIASNRAKDPPTESSGAIWTRRLIIFAFWVVVVFLGLPQWVWTTTTPRAVLPLDSMNDWAAGQVRFSYVLLLPKKADQV